MEGKLLYLVLSFAGSLGSREVSDSMDKVEKVGRSFFDGFTYENKIYANRNVSRRRIRKNLVYSE
jgi:hypothetical protein